MFYRQSDVNDELVNEIVYKSMSIYPTTSYILPMVLSLDLEQILSFNNLPIYSGQQMRCEHCMAYFNAYCLIHDHPSVWKCSICGSVNPLPLPPSNSFDTGFSLARKAVPYNHAIFDIIEQKKHHNTSKNLIIVAVQLYFDEIIFKTISDAIDENDTENEYILIVFDSNVQIFNGLTKRFNVLCYTDNEFFLPAPIESLKTNAKACKFVLSNLVKSANFSCCLNQLSYIVKLIETANQGNIKEKIPAKFIMFLSGIPLAPSISINICSDICVIGPNANTLNYCNDLTDIQGSSVNYIENPNDLLKISVFAKKCFGKKVIKDLHIQFFAPRSTHVESSRRNSIIASIDRVNYSASQQKMIVQAEISFNEKDEKKITRIIAVKIPLAFELKIYKSMTFKRQFRCLYSISSYLIDKICSILSDHKLFQVRTEIFNLALRYPMDQFFTNFVFAIFNSRAISEDTNPLSRRGIFHWLRTMPLSLQFLYFLPLEVDGNGQVTPILPSINQNAIARITHDSIFVKECDDDPKIIAQKAMNAIDASHVILPIYVVKEFYPSEDKTQQFQKWKESWSYNVYQIQNNIDTD